MHADGDAPAVVDDGHGAVGVDDDLHVRAEPGEVLVDGVVDHLPHEVVQARTVVRVADVHAGALANGLEAFEHLDGVLLVPREAGGVRRRAWRRRPDAELVIGHA